MEGGQCPFCAIASGAIKSSAVYQSDEVMAILDINPATKGHTIIMPKTHFNSLYEMPPPAYMQLMSIARAIAYALKLSTGCNTVDLVYTQELRKGQFTPHVLVHAIPRYEDDTVNYIWQPNPLQEEDAAELASLISSTIDNIMKSETQESQKTPEKPPAPQPEKEPEKPEKKEEPVELKKKVVVF